MPRRNLTADNKAIYERSVAVMMIFPDIYLLSGTAYGLHQNIYGIDCPEENSLVLIDCGLDEKDLAVIEKTMERFGLEDRKITDVFITHSHFDHSGNAAELERQGVTVHIGEYDAESIRTGDTGTIAFAYGRRFPTVSQPDEVADGESYMIPGAEIIAHHTPGHSKGSVCYELRKDGRKILFTGDFLQIDPTGEVIPGIKVDPAYDYDEYLASAAAIRDLDIDAMLCGHYQPVLSSPTVHVGRLYRQMLVNRNEYM